MGKDTIRGTIFLNYLVDKRLEPVAKGSVFFLGAKKDTKSKFRVDITDACRETENGLEFRLGISGYVSIFRDAIEYFFKSVGLPDSVCKPTRRHDWSIFRIPEEKKGYRLVRELIEAKWKGFEKEWGGSPYSYPIK